jgi:hypothetical protein
MALKDGPELATVNRFDQLVCGAKSVAAGLLIHDREHDDRNLGQLGVALQRSEHPPAVQLWHYHIQNDGFWL